MAGLVYVDRRGAIVSAGLTKCEIAGGKPANSDIMQRRRRAREDSHQYPEVG